MKLVDSSLLLDYATGTEAALAYLQAHDKEPIGASTIVLSELYRGLVHTQDMSTQEAMSKYEWVTPVPFTNDAAAAAAMLSVDLHSDGEMIPRSDIYIAGTAISLGVPLVTADSHFDSIDGLTVESYLDTPS